MEDREKEVEMEHKEPQKEEKRPKDRFLCGILLVLILSVAAAIALFAWRPDFSSVWILHLPFAWIGKGLRFLSLSGAAGNAAAWIGYAVLALFPVGAALLRRKRGNGGRADLLLWLLGGYGCYMWYCYVNPFLFLAGLGKGMGKDAFGEAGMMLLSTAWWGIGISWAVLSAFDNSRKMEDSPAKRTMRRLKTVLKACVLLYVVYDGYFELAALLKSMQSLWSRGDMTGVAFAGAEGIFGYVLDGFAVALLFLGIHLVTAMEEDWYQERVEQIARQMGELGKTLVYMTVLGNVAGNLLRLLAAGSLLDVNISVEIPLIPLILALAACILGDYFESGRKNYEDTTMII